MKIFKRWSGALVFPKPEDPILKILIKVLMPSEIQSIVDSDTPAFSPQRSVRIVEPEQQKVYENLVEQEHNSSRTSSSTSTSTSNPSETSQGLLHCVYKNGLPNYTCALSECGQALAAKIEKLHNSGREDFDWIYTFHSTEEDKKKKHRRRWIPSGRKENHAPDLVGRMKVSTSLCPKFNDLGSLEHTLETEFVLCSATASIEESPGSPPMQRPPMQPRLIEKCIPCPHHLDYMSTSPGNSSDFFSPATPNTSISTTITNQQPVPGYVASPSYNIKKTMMHERKVGHSSRSSFHGCTESSSFRSESENGNVDIQESRSSLDMFEAFHLSSIVIRTPFSPSLKDKPGKDNVSKNSWGWGLKFLEKIASRSRSQRPQKKVVIQEDYYRAECSSTDVPMMGSASSPGRCSHDGHSLGGDQSRCGEQSDSSVTVIVAAQKHSLPTLKSTRPSSLIERWKLGGKCDCGGWGSGCSFTLFQSQKQNRNDLPEGISESENSNSLFVLFKGGRQDALALTMLVVHEGLYFLTFQSQLSALQVFSIGVALLHGQNPVMHEKNEVN